MYTKQTVGFIAHPKTGSTSAMSVLLGMGFQQCGGHHDVRPEWIPGLEVVGATVRNPWDVMVSWWFHKGTDPVTASLTGCRVPSPTTTSFSRGCSMGSSTPRTPSATKH